MIEYVRGELTGKDPATAIVEACGIGYRLLIPLSTYDKLPRIGSEVKLLAYHDVREESETLFGFAGADEREMFVRLTGVSGVGPKIALAILSGSSTGELAMAIATGDYKRISAIRGVGKKTAEKICIELKDKVDRFVMRPGDGGGVSPAVRDALAALRSLGFSEEVSTKMVSGVIAADPALDDVEKIIKLALSGK